MFFSLIFLWGLCIIYIHIRVVVQILRGVKWHVVLFPRVNGWHVTRGKLMYMTPFRSKKTRLMEKENAHVLLLA